MEKLLAKLSPKPQSTGGKNCVNLEISTKLPEQQGLFEKQRRILASNSEATETHIETTKYCSVLPTTSTFESLDVSALVDAEKPDATHAGTSEVLRLKQELYVANSKLALQEQELAQTRVIKHTLDQALGPPSEADFNGREITEQTISHLQNAFNESNPSFSQLQDGWSGQEDSQSDISDALSAGAFNRARGIWVPPTQQVLGMSANAPNSDGDTFSLPGSSLVQAPNRPWGSSIQTPNVPGHSSLQSRRVFSSSSGISNLDTRFAGEQARYLQGTNIGPRRSIAQSNRGGSCFSPHNSAWGAFAAGSPSSHVPRSPTSRQSSTYQPIGLYQVPTYHQQPAATALSPTAAEFTSTNSAMVPWGATTVSLDRIRFLASDLHI
ncbi:hypothetical protein EYZ11_006147 [Aspergillus tanneri]|uniref:Uncharacterized protein n=1 Tax=Aspergillus tanneri TaxID=1220188 RepID=A0A4S3JG81_9EURO|nr:hypothetical protein EYZ11_006147 [Aspergillus tanneri]